MGPEIAGAKNGTSLAEQIMLLGRLASQSAEVETSHLNSFKLPDGHRNLPGNGLVGDQ